MIRQYRIVNRFAAAVVEILMAPFVIFKLVHDQVEHSNLASFVRKRAYAYRGAKIGKGTYIGPRTQFRGCQNLIIGENVFIGEHTRIIAYNAPVVIGDSVLIADNVYINSRNHNFRQQKLISNQGYTDKPITIADDCWICHGAVIVTGSELKSKTVIGANVTFSGKTRGNTIVKQSNRAERYSESDRE